MLATSLVIYDKLKNLIPFNLLLEVMRSIEWAENYLFLLPNLGMLFSSHRRHQVKRKDTIISWKLISCSHLSILLRLLCLHRFYYCLPMFTCRRWYLKQRVFFFEDPLNRAIITGRGGPRLLIQDGGGPGVSEEGARSRVGSLFYTNGGTKTH